MAVADVVAARPDAFEVEDAARLGLLPGIAVAARQRLALAHRVGEVPVHRGDVIAVGRILRLQLPVGAHDIGALALQHLHALFRLVGHQVDERPGAAEEGLEILDIRVETGEDEAAIGGDPGDRLEIGAEPLQRFPAVARIAPPHADAPAVGVERPAVIAAGDGGLNPAAPARQHRAAMRAGIVKAADFAVEAADREYRVAPDRAPHIAAAFAKLAVVADIAPAAPEDPLDFALEQAGLDEGGAPDPEHAVCGAVVDEVLDGAIGHFGSRWSGPPRPLSTGRSGCGD